MLIHSGWIENLVKFVVFKVINSWLVSGEILLWKAEEDNQSHWTWRLKLILWN